MLFCAVLQYGSAWPGAGTGMVCHRRSLGPLEFRGQLGGVRATCRACMRMVRYTLCTAHRGAMVT